MLPTRWMRIFVPPLVFTALCLHLAGDRGPANSPRVMAFPSTMPATVIWAWEEPEDLRSAPPTSVGVAFLAETIFLGAAGGNVAVPVVTVLPRRQPLAVATGAAVMAVVRLIASPGFRDSDDLRQQTIAALAAVSRKPGLRALQIDFDATHSQSAFYAAVLRGLRAQMPVAMPLSITALVSWCAANPGPGEWLSALPIDEAVPMFFRMGGSIRAGDDKSGYPIREPICRGSVGISTDESWPPLHARERIYVFAPRPWTPLQLAVLDDIASNPRSEALQYSYAAAGLRPPNDSGLRPEPNPPAPVESPSEEKLP
jgi:Protein of unknown function (DUF3142)